MDTEHDKEPILPGSTWRYYPGIAAASWSYQVVVQHLSVAEMRSLFGQGFSKISLEQSSMLIALEGQLCEVLTVERAGKVRRLARKADKGFITRTPVALMFRVPALLDGAVLVGHQDPTTSDPMNLEIYHDLPPPQFGECALIWEGTSWRLHEILELNREAKLVQEHMAELIGLMASPAAAWIRASTPREEKTVSPGSDHVVLPADGPDTALTEHLADIATMRRRQAIDPATWSQQWARLREYARQLASLYWSLLKQGPSRVAVVDATSPAVRLPGDVITHTIMRSLVTGEEYQANAKQTVATWVHPLRQTPVTITIERADGESWQQLLTVLDGLGDEAVDVFCAVLGIALTTNGNMNLNQSFYVAPDDILTFCGRKQSNRTFTAASRLGILQGLVTLSRIQVRMTVPGKRRGREYCLQSPVVEVLHSTVGEYLTDTGDAVWQRREIKLGNWASLVPQLHQQTVSMLRTILRYHPQKDRFTKRLGRFLTLQFAADPAPLDMSIRDLLLHAGIPFDPAHHQDRTRTVVERAMHDLMRDHLIRGATPLIEATPAGWARQERIAQCSRGWWRDYEQQVWRIEPMPIPQDHVSAIQMAMLEEHEMKNLRNMP
jgi:hypothetical protein